MTPRPAVYCSYMGAVHEQFIQCIQSSPHAPRYDMEPAYTSHLLQYRIDRLQHCVNRWVGLFFWDISWGWLSCFVTPPAAADGFTMPARLSHPPMHAPQRRAWWHNNSTTFVYNGYPLEFALHEMLLTSEHR